MQLFCAGMHWKDFSLTSSHQVEIFQSLFRTKMYLCLSTDGLLSCDGGLVTQRGNSVLKGIVKLEDTRLICLTLTAEASSYLWPNSFLLRNKSRSLKLHV